MSIAKKKAPRFLVALIVILVLEFVVIIAADSWETDARMDAPCLKVTSAWWIAPETQQEDDYGYILAAVENYGKTAGRRKPDLLYGGAEQEEYRYYADSKSYYDQIDADSDESYEGSEVVPPGASVPLICPVDETAFMNMQELLLEEGKIYVTLPESWAREQIYCELEISADIINWE
ncbi:MAG: hypothetical protein IJ512_00255 [Ruminococcus sp.]|nr:hypothetical protein [Ruminococcus sp.]